MKNFYLLIVILIFPLAGISQTMNFSTQRGFFQAPFQLNLSTSISGGSIRYTTDGSTPSPTNGTLYSGSISVNSTAVIRAIGYSGPTVTPVTTHSYLFLDNVVQQPATISGWPNHSYALGSGTATAVHDYQMDPNVVNSPAYSGVIKEGLLSIPTMSLVLNRDTFMNLYEGESTFTASVEILYPDGTKEQFDCGLESHSHNRLKRSLKLNIKSLISSELFKKGLLNTTDAATTFKNTKIVLRAGNNRSWARNWNPDRTCYTRDEWYRSSQQAISQTGGRGTFVHLYVNGLYWGLYNPVERTDAGMLSNNFGGEFEDWMALDHDGIRSGDPARFNYLTTTLVGKDMAVGSNYAELKEYLDVDKFSDYLILTWMTGMTDWPANNFHGGNRNNPPSPYFYNAWDCEWSWDTSNGSSNGAWVHPSFRTSQSTNTTVIPKIWHSIRRNADFMQTFADRVYRNCFNNGGLTDEASRARWAILNNYIKTAIVAESARWGDALQDGITRTRDNHWTPEVNRVDGLMNGNVNRFINALLSEGYYSNIGAPLFSAEGGEVTPGFLLSITNPNTSGTIYYTTNGSDPRESGGTVASAATTYSGPIAINSQLTLKSRVLNGNVWSPLHEATFKISNLITGLFINEFLASNTKFADENGGLDDWIEIYNSNNQAVDIGGLYLTDNLSVLNGAQIPTTSPALTTIPAKGYIVIWADGQPEQGPLHILPKLGKGGEQIGLSQIVGANTIIIDSLTFKAQADDVSEGRFPDGSTTMKKFFSPTPGSTNTITFRSGLFINEILAFNQTSITDEFGEHNGWIEIYNNNSQPVNIGGMYLTNNLSVPNSFQIPSTQPALTTIPAKGFITLWADNQPAQGALHLGFLLTATGGSLQLSDIIGPDVFLVDSISYQAQTVDRSLGRYPDASKQTKLFSSPSPASPNVLPQLSNLFINEFMASNSKLADEFGVFEDWIEIYNANSTPVDIGGLFITDNLSNLTKYQIPTNQAAITTIPGGGFLRLWADEEPFQGVLHVGVKLSAGGEQIGLSQQNASVVTIIDSLTYTAQTTDVSRGRQPNGSSTFVNFTSPTPGASNNTVPAGQQLISFTLINANTEQDIQTISSGTVINLATLPTSNLNIRANTSPATVGRVVLALSGAQTRNVSETVAPYALFGDVNGNYNNWVPPLGSYILTGTPYTTSSGGTAGTPLTVNFSVVRNAVTNQLPVANAGTDKTIVLPASSVALTGSGNDAEDGTNVSFAWNQVSGPNVAVFSNTTVPAPTVSSLIAGTYVFSLTVKDQNQASSVPDQVSVFVTASSAQAVVSFTLVNANTEQDIQVINNGDVLDLATLPVSNLNIRANTNPATVGRVVMALSGAQVRNVTETSAPYSLFGDVNGNYNNWVPPLGNYSLKGTPYTTSSGGTAGTALTVNFSVVRTGTNQLPVANAGQDIAISLPLSNATLNGTGTDAEDGTNVTYAWSQISGPNTALFNSTSANSPNVSGLIAGTYSFSLTVKDQQQATSAPDQVTVTVNPASNLQVTSFTLINANTEQAIQTISSGSTLNLATLPTSNLNIRANTSPVTIGRVVFALSGALVRNVTETTAPYALFGDVNGNYNSWIPASGSYTLKATPYATSSGGTAGTILTINFNVINQPVPLTLASMSPLMQVKPAVYFPLQVYPNPVSEGRVTISIGKDIGGKLSYTLRDQMGNRLSSGIMISAHPSSNITFDFSKYMEKVGVYYLQLDGDNLKTVIKLIR